MEDIAHNIQLINLDSYLEPLELYPGLNSWAPSPYKHLNSSDLHEPHNHSVTSVSSSLSGNHHNLFIYCNMLLSDMWLTFTKKNVIPYVFRDLASCVYLTLASTSLKLYSCLCSINIFFSILLALTYSLGRKSFNLESGRK